MAYGLKGGNKNTNNHFQVTGTVKLLNNGPSEERPLVNNGQILIALVYFNTFATLKGGHP